jgi:hypothetical protein
MLAYFRSPVPSREGFSAYRTPGAAVHGPVLLAFSFVGFLLCWPHPWLRPLLMVWVLAGLYLGRDIAILSHYNPLLTLLSWAAFVTVLVKPAAITKFGAAHAITAATLSIGVGSVLALLALAITRERTQNGQTGA